MENNNNGEQENEGVDVTEEEVTNTEAVDTEALDSIDESEEQTNNEDESEESEEEESEEETEEETEEENISEEFENASEELTKFTVKNKAGQVVKLFTLENHGDDFAELAEAYAKRNNMVAAPYRPEIAMEEAERDVVHIVTANDQPVRTYSLEAHGKKYKTLAKGFVAKYGERKGYKIKD